jgi:methionine-rich copper-binding protein CopC
MRGLRAASGSAALGVLLLVAAAGAAAAHTDLVSSFPVAGDRVDELPHQVVLEFDEPMQIAEDGLVLRAPGGRPFPADVLAAGGGDVYVAVPSPEATPPAGRWTVEYSALSTDGHVATGGVEFWVGVSGALMPSDDESGLVRSLALLLVLLAGGFAVVLRTVHAEGQAP